MGSLRLLSLAAICSVCFCSAQAFAGITTFAYINNSDTNNLLTTMSDDGIKGWTWTPATSSTLGEAVVSSNFFDSTDAVDDIYTLAGHVSNDPIYDQEVIVRNRSFVTWTGFVLTVGGTPSTIVYDLPPSSPNPTADRFSVLSSISPTTAIFSGGTVAPGQTVIFDFFINVPVSDTDFTIALTEHPVVTGDVVPEPASLSLLAIGAAGLLARKRR